MYTVVDKCNWKTKQCRNRRACYAGNCVAETQANTQLSLSRFPWITPTVTGEIFGHKSISQNPSVFFPSSTVDIIHVAIFRFFFIKFEVYSWSSSKMMGNSPEVSSFNRLLLRLHQFICNKRSVFPVHCLHMRMYRNHTYIPHERFWVERVGLVL